MIAVRIRFYLSDFQNRERIMTATPGDALALFDWLKLKFRKELRVNLKYAGLEKYIIPKDFNPQPSTPYWAPGQVAEALAKRVIGSPWEQDADIHHALIAPIEFMREPEDTFRYRPGGAALKLGGIGVPGRQFCASTWSKAFPLFEASPLLQSRYCAAHELAHLLGAEHRGHPCKLSIMWPTIGNVRVKRGLQFASETRKQVRLCLKGWVGGEAGRR